MPMMDESAIETLQAFLPPNQIKALLTESLTDIEGRIHRLGVRLDSADAAGAAREAHDLVSVAGNCGARALSTLARDIERACKQGAVTDASLGFTRLQEVAAGSIRALTNLRDALMQGVGANGVGAEH
jgi:HPt (histidine-containing phosphotransfer) domain-containing protein